MPALRCRWVQGTNKGVMKDPYGFTTVDLEKVGYKEEPFVLTDQVFQVFYIPDTRNKKRHEVLREKDELWVSKMLWMRRSTINSMKPLHLVAVTSL